MYSKRPLKDALVVIRAAVTNQVARFAPKAYFSAIRETGRGPNGGSERELANYSRKCFSSYLDRLRIHEGDATGFLEDANVLELGPGDFPGVALLFIAYGARQVICVDRFPLLKMSSFNLRAMEHLLNDLGKVEASRAKQALRVHGEPESGLNPAKIRYVVEPHGHAKLQDWADVVVSTAVLEHVDRLKETFKDMRCSMRPGAKAVHLVDLRSHRLHRENPLDFLMWPEPVWRAMFSHKGAPNRARIGEYISAINDAGLKIEEMTPTATFDVDVVRAVRPFLPARFASQSDEQLAWQAFWLVCRRTLDRTDESSDGVS